jgi:flavin-dependent dehydrogenase
VIFSRAIPIWEPYDLVVCGGGPSGIPAALAARRGGLSVLLVEGQGQLGGTTTSAGVSHLLGGRTPDNRQPLVGGIFAEITEELVARGGAIDPRTIDGSGKYQPHGWLKGSLAAGVPVEPHLYAALLDEKMLDAGVDVLFFTQFVEPVVAAGRVTRVVLFNKSGLFAVPCRAVVDATGDADVAARAGCQTVKGRQAAMIPPMASG